MDLERDRYSVKCDDLLADAEIELRLIRASFAAHVGRWRSPELQEPGPDFTPDSERSDRTRPSTAP